MLSDFSLKGKSLQTIDFMEEDPEHILRLLKMIEEVLIKVSQIKVIKLGKLVLTVTLLLSL